MIITDTGSHNDIAFGLITLLDFDHRPQLADLPDAKLWRLDPAADYGTLNATACGKIDPARITGQWPDILRVVASIHTGAVPAYDILRVLAPGGTPTQLGDCARTTAGSSRRCTSGPTSTTSLTAARSRACATSKEGRHDLARTMYQGRKGELRHGYRTGWKTSSARSA